MKALALFSGGLDSSLAIKLILNQNIEVIALHFVIPLSRFDKDKEDSINRKANELGVPLRIIHLKDDFVEIFKNPKFGYGKNYNPCMDCKILMLKHARGLMRELEVSFIITGEVLSQRPKSQHRDSLNIIEKESGLRGLLLRPLSAKLLSPTLPETEGWVKRENLFDFNGRSRNPQFKLAKILGIKEFSWPAGGCLLTIPSFCPRAKDVLKHGECNVEDLELLTVGRHFRLSETFKLIVGRNEKENNILLKKSAKDDFIFEPLELAGPTGLGRGSLDENIKELCSRIIAWYTSAGKFPVSISIKDFFKSDREIVVIENVDNSEFKPFMI